MVLLDTASEQWCAAPAELGAGVPIGQLLTPLTRYRDYGATYAIDNGAYSGFEASDFKSLLARQDGTQDRCRFVVVPDVVGSARRTLEVFHHWKTELRGWRRALAIQNGQESLPIPWNEIAAVFIAGDDEFKDGPHAKQVIRAAQAMNKWVHVGRVNGAERVKWCVEMGVDSIDGSGISMYSHMRVKLGRAIRGEEDPGLYDNVEAA
jgi:hypothetical protein